MQTSLGTLILLAGLTVAGPSAPDPLARQPDGGVQGDDLAEIHSIQLIAAQK